MQPKQYESYGDEAQNKAEARRATTHHVSSLAHTVVSRLSFLRRNFGRIGDSLERAQVIDTWQERESPLLASARNAYPTHECVLSATNNGRDMPGQPTFYRLLCDKM